MSYVFNDTTHAQDGLIQECEDICNLGAGGISGNSAKLATFTRRINQGIDRFFSIAFKNDQLWSFDDTNQTDLPVATTNLVASQQDYSFASELLEVTQVFVKDSSTTYKQIFPQDDRTTPYTYSLTSDTGAPQFYELVGNSIMLYPAPNAANAFSSGLKVTFKRNGTKFANTDGAVPVGIPSLFHAYLARYASYPFLVEKSLKHATAVKQLILEDEAAIAYFIANRAKPKRASLQVTQEDNK